ncbi:hypothetical protein HY571_00380 [Candidatus Micrarchaeota archaeon]|nr:hypothetical protein [Candidatus Micrarchaeota archaeon]
MKKILLGGFFALFLLAPLLTAAPVCGSTCPVQCTSAGLQCTPQDQPGQTETIQGRELTCIQTQNVGCSLQLGWPLVVENSCQTGFTHDAATDGPIDCGFLGLGAIFGGSVKNCHASQEIACSATASCPAGFQVKNTNQCSSAEQQGEASLVQCCEIGSEPPFDIDIPDEDELDRNVSNYGQVMQIQIEPANPVIPINGQIQFIARGLTPAGLSVDVSDVSWSIVGSVGNLTLEGLFTACTDCRGQAIVTATHGPLSASTTVNVVQITDYRIEPQNVSVTEGGRALLLATALDLTTSQRRGVESTWQSSFASITRPQADAMSKFAIITGEETGNGSIQATTGLLSANSTIFVVPSDGFQAFTLVVHPGVIRVAEGEQVELFVLVRDAAGVYGPLPEAVTLDIANNSIAAIADSTFVRGLAPGETTINVSSGALWVSIPIEVTGCNPSSRVICGAEEAGWNYASFGQGEKTCQEDQTWSACRDIDSCDNVPRPQQGLADGVVCSGWCEGSGDPDCACTGSETRTCTDVVSRCWGTMTCNGDTYASCRPSPSCTGELFSGTVVPSNIGLFNGFICAGTDPVPAPLNLAAVSSCQEFGSTAPPPAGTACEETRTIELWWYEERPLEPPITWVYIARSGVPGANYSLSEVQESAVMLSINDTGTGDSIPVLLPEIGASTEFNARVMLESTDAVEPSKRSATLRFEYDNCLFDLSQG